MKATFWKKFLPLLMTIVMLFSVFSAAFPAISALEISSPPTSGTSGETPYYQIVFEDGVLRIRLHPQKIYEMLEDGDLTREELLHLLPEDVLATLEKGRDISIEDLKALVSHYLSASDLQALKETLPMDVFKKHFDLSMLEDLLTVEEILSIIPIDDLLANLDDDAIAELITPAALQLLLNERAKEEVLTEAFVEDLLENSNILDEILQDEALKAELAKLIDGAVIDQLLANEAIKANLLGLMEQPAVLDKILADSEALASLQSYFSSKTDAITRFLSDKDILDTLKNLSDLYDSLVNETVINRLVTNNVIHKDNLRTILTDAQLKSLLTSSKLENLLKNSEFVNKVLGDNNLVQSLMTDELLGKLLDAGVFDGKISPSDVFPDTINWGTFASTYGITAENFAEKFNLDPWDILNSYGTVPSMKTVLEGEGISPEDICSAYGITIENFAEKFNLDPWDLLNTYGTVPSMKTVLEGEGISSEDICSAYGITLENFIETFALEPMYLFEKYGANPSLETVLEGEGISAEDICSTYGITLENFIGTFHLDSLYLFRKYGANLSLEAVLEGEGISAEDICSAYGITIENFAEKFNLDPWDLLNTYGTAPNIQDVLEGENIAAADICSAYGITVPSLIENGFISEGDLYDAQIIREILLENATAREIISQEISGGSISLDQYWHHLDFTMLINAVGIPAIKDLIDSDRTIYNKLLQTIPAQDIVNALGEDLCTKILQDNAATILRAVGFTNFFEFFPRDEIVGVLGGYFAIIQKKYVAEEDVIAAVGGYSALLSYLSMEDVIEKIGYDRLLKFVSFQDIVASAGGYDKVFSWYTMTEIQAILNAIGTDRLQAFLSDSSILTQLDFQQIISDLLALLRSKGDTYQQFIAEVVNRLLLILNTEVNKIYLNDTTIYRPGRFDFEAIVVSILQAIPDVSDFLAMEEGDALAQWILRTEIGEKEYTLGISIEFIGDFSQLQTLVSNRADSFHFDVSDTMDVTTSFTLPAAVTTIYENLLLSDRVSDSLKEKLLTVPSTLKIEELETFLLELSDAELQSFVDVIGEKANEIRTKLYEKLDTLLQGNDKQLTSAKAKIEKILSAFDSVENLKKLRSKAISLLHKLPAEISEKKISELYEGNGSFHATGTFSENLYDRVIAALQQRDISKENAENMLVYFGNSLTLDGRLDLGIHVRDLYQLSVTDNDGETYLFYLPEGFALQTLNELVPSMNFTFEDGALMPPRDEVLAPEELWWRVDFYADGILQGSVDYVVGSQSLDPSLLPVIPAKNGYTAAWPTFSLNVQEILRVDATYTPNLYQTTFRDTELNLSFSLHYDIEDRELLLPIPSKHGYNFVTWYIDTDRNGRIDAYDIRLTQLPSAARSGSSQNASFALPAGYSLPTENNLALIPVFELAYYNITFYDASGTLIENVTLTYSPLSFDKNALFAQFPTLPHDYYDLYWYVGQTPWEEYDLYLGGNIQVTAHLEPISFSVTFDGVSYGDHQYTVEDLSFYIPTFPSRVAEGYDGDWYVVKVNGVNITPIKLSAYEVTFGDLEIQSCYTPINYTITFLYENGDTVTTLNFNIEDGLVGTVPAVPQKNGYDGAWESYSLTLPGNQRVYPIYTARSYNAIFLVDGMINDQKGYTAYSTIDAPQVPDKTATGYGNGTWYVVKVNGVPCDAVKLSDYTVSFGDLEIEARYTPIVYTATFVDENGGELSTVNFTIPDGWLGILPDVPTKPYYSGEWRYKLTPQNLRIAPTYTANTYYAYFMDGIEILDTKNYSIESSLTIPPVPDKSLFGYGNGAWYVIKVNGTDVVTPVLLSQYLMTDCGDLTVEARYTPIVYTAIFRVDGVEIGGVEFTVEDTVLDGIPPLPERYGYDVQWSDFELGRPGNIYVDAIFTLKQFTATFESDNGEVVAKINFTINDTELGAPKVPGKTGYLGKWYVVAENGKEISPVLLSEYTLIAADLTVKAIYEPSVDGNEHGDAPAPGDDEEKDSLAWLWWILSIFVLILIALIVLWILWKKNLPPFNSAKNTPPAAAETATSEEDTKEGTEKEDTVE